jgi:hypothetical protein
MKGFAEVLLRTENLTEKQEKIVEEIIKRCELVRECWEEPCQAIEFGYDTEQKEPK